MTEEPHYEEDLTEEPMPDDEAVDDSRADLGSPHGSWKHERATEQDELDQLDPEYADPDPEV